MEFTESVLKLNQNKQIMNKENLTKFYQTYKLYIFPAVVALSSLFLIVFAIYPQTIKLITNQAAATDLTNKSKFLAGKVLALESIDEQDLARKLDYAVASYPTDKDFGTVVGLLQKIAAQSGFTIISFSLGNPDASGKNSGYEIKLETTGAKALVASLLNNLENSPRLMRVNNINVSSKNESSSVSVSLVIEVLYSSAPQNFGSADSPLPELSQKDEELIARLVKSGGLISQPSDIIKKGKANPFE